MTKETKDNQATQTTETFIEEVEVKKTRKSPANTSNQSEDSKKAGDSYKVIVPLLNIREKASMVAEVLGTLQEDDVVEIIARTPKGFGKLADDKGYVKLDYVEKVEKEK